MVIYLFTQDVVLKDNFRNIISNNSKNLYIYYFESCTQFKTERDLPEPDLVFLDVDMDNGRGLFFCSGLKDRFKHAELIMISENKNRSLEAVYCFYSGFMLKPLNKEDIIFQINRFDPYESMII